MQQSQALFETYKRASLRFERGEGVWLTTADGERYLDFAAGVAVNSLGHCHPHIVAALKRQADKLWHVSNLYEMPGQEVLADRLTGISFAEKVFFTNSGAEAVECAIKTARRYHFSHGRPDRYQILTFEGAFHGRTIATVAAGGNEKYIEGFGPKAPGFDQLPFGDLEAVRKGIGPQTAAILLEPVQGEGGVRCAPVDFLQALRRLCDEHQLLLVFDEVQCGIGRTGKLFAHEWADVQPDIMAVAKGIGGGFPVGACLATARAAAGMEAGSHGSTYGGNPLAMAVAGAVLDVVLDRGFLENVLRVSETLDSGLKNLKARYPAVIDEVTGKGLMLGVRSVVPCAQLVEAIREEKMLVVGAGNNSIRLLPPLIVTQTEACEGLDRVERAVRRLA